MTKEKDKQNKKDEGKEALSNRKKVLISNIKLKVKVGDSIAELIEINKLLRS